jgi:hypothetical protein
VSAFSPEEPIESQRAGRKEIVFGRFMLPDTSEHPCQVLNINIDGATFLASHVPPTGLAVVAYIEDLGRVEALSGEAVEGGFRVEFNATGSRRERLQARINWLSKNDDASAENRRHPRYEPREKTSQITLPDGRVYSCEVLDISISGAAVKSDVMPSVGTYLMLGRMKGRVIRYLDTGVAIEFVKQLDKVQLTTQIA